MVIVCYNGGIDDAEGKGMIYNFDGLCFQVLAMNRFVHQNGHFCVKGRPFSALSFRVKGSGSFKVGEKSFLVRQGDVLFIPANTPYEVEYSFSESIVLHLTHCNYAEAEAFSLNKAAEISLLATQMLEAWNKWQGANRAKAGAYDILDRIDADRRSTMAHTAFSACLQYIEAHYCEPELDIGAVCAAGFMSVSNLQRAFLQHFGTSPKQYIIALRMQKALMLLAESTHTVKEVAFACGFVDEKYFSRAFRSKYGYPPSRWKRHMLA